MVEKKPEAPRHEAAQRSQGMKTSEMRAAQFEELKVEQEVWVKARVIELVEPNHRGVGIGLKVGKQEFPLWVNPSDVALATPSVVSPQEPFSLSSANPTYTGPSIDAAAPVGEPGRTPGYNNLVEKWRDIVKGWTNVGAIQAATLMLDEFEKAAPPAQGAPTPPYHEFDKSFDVAQGAPGTREALQVPGLGEKSPGPGHNAGASDGTSQNAGVTLPFESQELSEAAVAYYEYAVQDEAAERQCCVSDEHHERAKRLRDAVEDYKRALAQPGAPTKEG
jgi:hypothetical protein